jgi:hypothetical protein
MEKEVEMLSYEGDMMVIRPHADEANDDWIRSARLARAAKEGDKKAAAELARLESGKMMQVTK